MFVDLEEVENREEIINNPPKEIKDPPETINSSDEYIQSFIDPSKRGNSKLANTESVILKYITDLFNAGSTQAEIFTVQQKQLLARIAQNVFGSLQNVNNAHTVQTKESLVKRATDVLNAKSFLAITDEGKKGWQDISKQNDNIIALENSKKLFCEEFKRTKETKPQAVTKFAEQTYKVNHESLTQRFKTQRTLLINFKGKKNNPYANKNGIFDHTELLRYEDWNHVYLNDDSKKKNIEELNEKLNKKNTELQKITQANNEKSELIEMERTHYDKLIAEFNAITTASNKKAEEKTADVKKFMQRPIWPKFHAAYKQHQEVKRNNKIIDAITRQAESLRAQITLIENRKGDTKESIKEEWDKKKQEFDTRWLKKKERLVNAAGKWNDEEAKICINDAHNVLREWIEENKDFKEKWLEENKKFDIKQATEEHTILLLKQKGELATLDKQIATAKIEMHKNIETLQFFPGVVEEFDNLAKDNLEKIKLKDTDNQDDLVKLEKEILEYEKCIIQASDALVRSLEIGGYIPEIDKNSKEYNVTEDIAIKISNAKKELQKKAQFATKILAKKREYNYQSMRNKTRSLNREISNIRNSYNLYNLEWENIKGFINNLESIDLKISTKEGCISDDKNTVKERIIEAYKKNLQDKQNKGEDQNIKIENAIKVVDKFLDDALPVDIKNITIHGVKHLIKYKSKSIIVTQNNFTAQQAKTYKETMGYSLHIPYFKTQDAYDRFIADLHEALDAEFGDDENKILEAKTRVGTSIGDIIEKTINKMDKNDFIIGGKIGKIAEKIKKDFQDYKFMGSFNQKTAWSLIEGFMDTQRDTILNKIYTTMHANSILNWRDKANKAFNDEHTYQHYYTEDKKGKILIYRDLGEGRFIEIDRDGTSVKTKQANDSKDKDFIDVKNFNGVLEHGHAVPFVKGQNYENYLPEFQHYNSLPYNNSQLDDNHPHINYDIFFEKSLYKDEPAKTFISEYTEGKLNQECNDALTELRNSKIPEIEKIIDANILDQIQSGKFRMNDEKSVDYIQVVNALDGKLNIEDEEKTNIIENLTELQNKNKNPNIIVQSLKKSIISKKVHNEITEIANLYNRAGVSEEEEDLDNSNLNLSVAQQARENDDFDNESDDEENLSLNNINMDAPENESVDDPNNDNQQQCNNDQNFDKDFIEGKGQQNNTLLVLLNKEEEERKLEQRDDGDAHINNNRAANDLQNPNNPIQKIEITDANEYIKDLFKNETQGTIFTLEQRELLAKIAQNVSDNQAAKAWEARDKNKELQELDEEQYDDLIFKDDPDIKEEFNNLETNNQDASDAVKKKIRDDKVDVLLARADMVIKAKEFFTSDEGETILENYLRSRNDFQDKLRKFESADIGCADLTSTYNNLMQNAIGADLSSPENNDLSHKINNSKIEMEEAKKGLESLKAETADAGEKSTKAQEEFKKNMAKLPFFLRGLHNFPNVNAAEDNLKKIEVNSDAIKTLKSQGDEDILQELENKILEYEKYIMEASKAVEVLETSENITIKEIFTKKRKYNNKAMMEKESRQAKLSETRQKIDNLYNPKLDGKWEILQHFINNLELSNAPLTNNQGSCISDNKNSVKKKIIEAYKKNLQDKQNKGEDQNIKIENAIKVVDKFLDDFFKSNDHKPNSVTKTQLYYNITNSVTEIIKLSQNFTAQQAKTYKETMEFDLYTPYFKNQGAYDEFINLLNNNLKSHNGNFKVKTDYFSSIFNKPKSIGRLIEETINKMDKNDFIIGGEIGKIAEKIKKDFQSQHQNNQDLMNGEAASNLVSQFIKKKEENIATELYKAIYNNPLDVQSNQDHNISNIEDKKERIINDEHTYQHYYTEDKKGKILIYRDLGKGNFIEIDRDGTSVKTKQKNNSKDKDFIDVKNFKGVLEHGHTVPFVKGQNYENYLPEFQHYNNLDYQKSDYVNNCFSHMLYQICGKGNEEIEKNTKIKKNTKINNLSRDFLSKNDKHRIACNISTDYKTLSDNLEQIHKKIIDANILDQIQSGKFRMNDEKSVDYIQVVNALADKLNIEDEEKTNIIENLTELQNKNKNPNIIVKELIKLAISKTIGDNINNYVNIYIDRDYQSIEDKHQEQEEEKRKQSVGYHINMADQEYLKKNDEENKEAHQRVLAELNGDGFKDANKAEGEEDKIKVQDGDEVNEGEKIVVKKDEIVVEEMADGVKNNEKNLKEMADGVNEEGDKIVVNEEGKIVVNEEDKIVVEEKDDEIKEAVVQKELAEGEDEVNEGEKIVVKKEGEIVVKKDEIVVEEMADGVKNNEKNLVEKSLEAKIKEAAIQKKKEDAKKGDEENLEEMVDKYRKKAAMNLLNMPSNINIATELIKSANDDISTEYTKEKNSLKGELKETHTLNDTIFNERLNNAIIKFVNNHREDINNIISKTKKEKEGKTTTNLEKERLDLIAAILETNKLEVIEIFNKINEEEKKKEDEDRKRIDDAKKERDAIQKKEAEAAIQKKKEDEDKKNIDIITEFINSENNTNLNKELSKELQNLKNIEDKLKISYQSLDEKEFKRRLGVAIAKLLENKIKDLKPETPNVKSKTFFQKIVGKIANRTPENKVKSMLGILSNNEQDLIDVYKEISEEEDKKRATDVAKNLMQSWDDDEKKTYMTAKSDLQYTLMELGNKEGFNDIVINKLISDSDIFDKLININNLDHREYVKKRILEVIDEITKESKEQTKQTQKSNINPTTHKDDLPKYKDDFNVNFKSNDKLAISSQPKKGPRSFQGDKINQGRKTLLQEQEEEEIEKKEQTFADTIYNEYKNSFWKDTNDEGKNSVITFVKELNASYQDGKAYNINQLPGFFDHVIQFYSATNKQNDITEEMMKEKALDEKKDQRTNNYNPEEYNKEKEQYRKDYSEKFKYIKSEVIDRGFKIIAANKLTETLIKEGRIHPANEIPNDNGEFQNYLAKHFKRFYIQQTIDQSTLKTNGELHTFVYYREYFLTNLLDSVHRISRDNYSLHNKISIINKMAKQCNIDKYTNRDIKEYYTKKINNAETKQDQNSTIDTDTESINSGMSNLSFGGGAKSAADKTKRSIKSVNNKSREASENVDEDSDAKMSDKLLSSNPKQFLGQLNHYGPLSDSDGSDIGDEGAQSSINLQGGTTKKGLIIAQNRKHFSNKRKNGTSSHSENGGKTFLLRQLNSNVGPTEFISLVNQNAPSYKPKFVQKAIEDQKLKQAKQQHSIF